MWIVKHLPDLSTSELLRYISLSQQRIRLNLDMPISQTLSWGFAAETGGVPCFIFIHEKLPIFGLCLATVPGLLECINGPLWNYTAQTKSIAVLLRGLHTELCEVFDLPPNQIKLAPRIPLLGSIDQAPNPDDEHLLSHTKASASTYILHFKGVVPCPPPFCFKPRLRRKLKRISTQIKHPTVLSRIPTHEIPFSKLYESLREHASFKNYTLLPEFFIKALLYGNPYSDLESLNFLIYCQNDGKKEMNLKSALIIAEHLKTATYLYGFEKRQPDTNSGTSAWLHFQTIQFLRRNHFSKYDFNGALSPFEKTETQYSGVDQFKRQFGGTYQHYAIPDESFYLLSTQQEINAAVNF